MNNFISPIQEISESLFLEKEVRVFLKRDDLLHPEVSGNKWRKLKYNLAAAKKQQHHKLLTFGGAYSNHIAAVAAAGSMYGFETVGIIRGEAVLPLNPTLQQAQEKGMQLHFISRSSYRQRNELSFEQQFGRYYLLPEGGTNALALKGCQEIVAELRIQLRDLTPIYIGVACGTGGTFSGMLLEAKAETMLGFSALKGDFMKDEVAQLLKSNKFDTTAIWEIFSNYHFGGYAKFTDELIEFINRFKKEHRVQLDPIYTGKMLFGIYDLLKRDYFPKKAIIVAVHSGGLQGIKGFNQRFGYLLQ